MGRHTHLKYHTKTDVTYSCDVCGADIKVWKSLPPPKCQITGQDLCKSCKRFVHIEHGSKKSDALISKTYVLCEQAYKTFVESLEKLVATFDEMVKAANTKPHEKVTAQDTASVAKIPALPIDLEADQRVDRLVAQRLEHAETLPLKSKP